MTYYLKIGFNKSDGTIKMFAYLILLHDPAPRPLLCIEELENYLYPTLLRKLAQKLREYAQRGGQVFVSTHSPDFVDALKIKELFLVKKEIVLNKVVLNLLGFLNLEGFFK